MCSYKRSEGALKCYKSFVENLKEKKKRSRKEFSPLQSYVPLFPEANTLAVTTYSGICLLASMFACLGKMQRRTWEHVNIVHSQE